MIAIIQGDARAIPLRDECVQCVVTSPPYWGLRKYAGAQGAEPYGLEPTIQRYLETTVDILREIRRVLRPDGVLFWNIGDSYSDRGRGCDSGSTLDGTRHNQRESRLVVNRRNKQPGLKPKDLCLIPARVAIAAQADGWWVRSIIIWAKPNPMPESCTDRPTDAYEHIIMLTKSEHYYWDADAVREPHADRAGIDRFKNGGGVSADTFKGRSDGVSRPPLTMVDREYNPLGRNLRNVWTFPTQPYKGAHFATFPEEIPRRCILAGSRPGDLVLDPFGGSGTTARVAVELNRRAVSLDLAYHDHAEKRTRNVQRRLM